MAVRTGLDHLLDSPDLLGPGERVGLLTNATGVTTGLVRNVDALLAAGIRLVALLGPEHGLSGTAQAGASETDARDEATGLPVVDLYAVRDQLQATLARLGLDVIVYDIQDAGARFFTYTWSLYDVMVAAARLGVRVVVLDRPNPLRGTVVEGPDLEPRWASFVGRAPLPQRHGLTIGELARLFNLRGVPERAGRPAQVDVIAMTGWRRDDPWQRTGLDWINPSPNLPTVASAYAFAATCLLEGTNASEGRGTTRPFELFGAPYVDRRFVPALRALDLPGVAFREAWFVPTFHKHAGLPVRGAQLHVRDTAAYRAVPVGVAVLATLATLYPDDFAVLPTGHLDRLWGSDTLRLTLAAGRDPAGLVPPAQDPSRYPADTLLY